MAVSRGHLRADLGMVISIFFVMLALSVIFLVCVEIALLLDCRVPHVMYIVQFRDVLLDSKMEDEEEEACWTLPLSA
jgi:hypothetical protein